MSHNMHMLNPLPVYNCVNSCVNNCVLTTGTPLFFNFQNIIILNLIKPKLEKKKKKIKQREEREKTIKTNPDRHTGRRVKKSYFYKNRLYLI